jgi:hypothetical protein
MWLDSEADLYREVRRKPRLVGANACQPRGALLAGAKSIEIVDPAVV